MINRIPVLIVDDDRDIRNYLTNLLNLATDFEPIVAEDAYRGLVKLKERPDIELILLDWMMPGMDAMEFITKVKSLERSPMVIMMTAKDSPDDVAHALAVGAIDYLIKPVNQENLLRKISTLMEVNSEGLRQQAARRIKVNYKAQTSFDILEFNSDECILASTFAVEEGRLLFINIPEANKALSLEREHLFSLKVMESSPLGNQYRITGHFVGLSRSVENQIKILNRYGKFA